MNSIIALGIAAAVLSPAPADRLDCLTLEGEPLRISAVEGAKPFTHTSSLSLRNNCDATATVQLRLSPSGNITPSGAEIETVFNADGADVLTASWDHESLPSAPIHVPKGTLDLTLRTAIGTAGSVTPGIHVADFQADWVIIPQHPAQSPTDILGVTGGRIDHRAVLAAGASVAAGAILLSVARRRPASKTQHQSEKR